MRNYQKEINDIQKQVSVRRDQETEIKREVDRLTAENKEAIAQRAALWRRASGMETLRTLAIVLCLALAVASCLTLKNYTNYIVAAAVLAVMIVLVIVLSKKRSTLYAESEPFSKQLDALDRTKSALIKEEHEIWKLEQQIDKLRKEERQEKLAQEQKERQEKLAQEQKERQEKLAQEQKERQEKFAREHKNTVIVSVKVAYSVGTPKEKNANFVPNNKSRARVFIDGLEVGHVSRPYGTFMANPGIHTIQINYYDDTYDLESNVQQFRVDDDCTMFYYFLGIGIPDRTSATKMFKDPAEFEEAIGAKLT